MNKTTKIALMSVTVALAGIALAAPSFKFSSDQSMNAMMAKGSEVINLTTYPDLKLVARNITKTEATFVYTIGASKSALKGAFGYYAKALEKEGWKADTMAKNGAMMAGDTMNKTGDAMAKTGDAMVKEGDTMTKGDAMNKPADTMAAGSMMMKPLKTKYVLGTHSIALSAKESKTTVEVELLLK